MRFFRRIITTLQQIAQTHAMVIQLTAAVARLERQEAKLMALSDDILAEATRGTTVGDSVLALVQKLIDASGGDPVKLQAALDAMKAENDKVEAAVLANTPQEPTP